MRARVELDRVTLGRESEETEEETPISLPPGLLHQDPLGYLLSKEKQR